MLDTWGGGSIVHMGNQLMSHVLLVLSLLGALSSATTVHPKATCSACPAQAQSDENN
jgi:hypothetical protein